MKKNLILIVIFYFALMISSYGAASSGGSKSSNYDKGVSLLKRGKKLEKKRENRKSKTKI